MSMPYVSPKAPPEEYDKWNDRRSYHKLQSLLSANFVNDSIYYIVTLRPCLKKDRECAKATK